MTWRWEYDPSEAYVIGEAPPAFVAEVEKRADELVGLRRPSISTEYSTRGWVRRETPHTSTADSSTSSFPGMNAYTSAR